MSSTKAPPDHVSIILDGNGRWAKLRNKPRTFGHYHGVKALGPVIAAASDMKIKYLSVFAFSTENWQRNKDEVSYLWRLPARFFKSAGKVFADNDVRFIHVGFKDNMPKNAAKIFDQLELATKKHTGMLFALVMNYGGKQDIVQAAQITSAAPFDQRLIAGVLPDVDLLVRTGGEKRLSNYLLWHCAYAELLFMDVLWPDYTPAHLSDNVAEYQQRSRRHGNVSDA